MIEMSEEAKAKLENFNKTAEWRAKCRKCGAQLKGTLAELLLHKCEGGGDDPDTGSSPTA